MSVQTVRRRSYYRLFGADAVLREQGIVSAAVLDVGCSDGRGSERLTGAFGCDIHAATLATAAASRRRDKVVQADIRTLPYRDAAFDAVVALDVIEHFDKPDAYRVLAEMERVAARLVVVMTPSGFHPQPPTETEPWQEHRCGFDPDELEARGYAVRGVGGWTGLRGAYGAFHGGPVGQALALLTGPTTRRKPKLAFHIVGVKRVGR